MKILKKRLLKSVGVCFLIMLILCGVIPWNVFATDEIDGYGIANQGSVSATIKARKVLQGALLQDGQFTFELIENNSVIQTAVNDANGDIVFQPIEYTNAGNYQYFIREVNGGKSIDGIIYDPNEYEVNVTIREEDLKAPNVNKIYYGHHPGDEIYVGENPGEKGYEVYCIDQSKTLPPVEQEAKKPYSVLNDPDSQTLERYVTLNRYGDKLEENLKKIFFYFQLFPDKYTIQQRKELVWTATGAYGDQDAQWETDLKEILQISLPDEYHLVLFLPEDVDYHQTLAMGYGAAITNTSDSDSSLDTAPPIFVNRMEHVDPKQTTAIIKAKKVLEGEVLKEGQFQFDLLDENGLLLQETKNDEQGNVQFQPITYDAPGEYKYVVREKNYGQTIDGIVHDASEYHVSVTVTQKDLEGFQDYVKYYGIAPTGNYVFIGENPGEQNYPVFCIDGKKTLPAEVPTTRFYKAVTDPNPEEAEKYVTHNLFGDRLTESLKKIFYYFQVYPDKYGIDEQKNIVWAATGYFGNSMAQYEEIVKEILTIELPEEYHLVIFLPQGEDASIYQPLGMGYGVDVQHYSDMQPEISMEKPVFVNKISDATTTFAPVIMKKLDGRYPSASEIFEFVLHEENGNIIQKVQNSRQYASFQPIRYTAKDAGKTFHYYIDETPKEGYLCDTERIEVTVKVSFEEFSGLTASGAYKKGNITTGMDSATFLNKTARDEVNFIPEVFKLVDGKSPKDSETFEFKMYTLTKEGKKGDLIGTASNHGRRIRFKPINYTKKDVGKTFRYRIEESEKEGFFCDTNPVDIEVVIKQNQDGLLQAESTYTKENVQGERTFQNSSLEKNGVISILKTVEGNAADNQEYFQFVIEASSVNEGTFLTGDYDVICNNPDDLGKGQKADSTLNVSEKSIRFDEEGRAVFYLKHNQKLSIRFPYDSYVSVEESSSHDYQVSLTLEGATTFPGAEKKNKVEFEYMKKHPVVNVHFTNTKYGKVVPTGISQEFGGMKIALGIGILGVSSMILIARKKKQHSKNGSF